MAIDYDVLKRVADKVIGDPRLLRMEWWAGIEDKENDNRTRVHTKDEGVAHCGTSACIAGWINIMAGKAELVADSRDGVYDWVLPEGITWASSAYEILMGEDWEDDPHAHADYLRLHRLFMSTGDKEAIRVLELIRDEDMELVDAQQQAELEEQAAFEASLNH